MYHMDKHVVKMILESAQLLSTAHRVLGGYKDENGRYQIEGSKNEVFYKATHANHPSAVWVRQSDQNYIWLTTLFMSLLTEYTHRYGKHHKCGNDVLVDALSRAPLNIARGPFTEPTQAMPDEYKDPNSSVTAYRAYYMGPKRHMAAWKNRSAPDWFK